MLDLTQNYFELFGLPLSYRVDMALLGDRYHVLQQSLHPDRFAASGDRERRLSMQASTYVNEAFQTLRNPLQRALYMLSLQGNESADDGQSTQDMAFLMDQMALREALAEARDEPNPAVAVEEILQRLENQAADLDNKLAACLEKPSVSDLKAARELVRKLQFVTKCRAEAESLEAELEGLG